MSPSGRNSLFCVFKLESVPQGMWQLMKFNWNNLLLVIACKETFKDFFHMYSFILAYLSTENSNIF